MTEELNTAEEYYSRANAPPAYFNCGMARAKLGDIERAKEDINYSQDIT
jgi:hypothetical protein